MDSHAILALGLGVAPPWHLVEQRLDTTVAPHVLHLTVAAERGATFACPVCGRPCKAHDFADFTWRHLNFFQHHCHITARVPRTACPDHGVRRITVPWAREGSRFTLLFEQAALVLVREMPVLAAARIMEITDTRLWRIVMHYVEQAVARLDLSALCAVGFDETAAKRGHSYVTVFIDLDRKDKPVVFVTPGRGKDTVARFKVFLARQGGDAGHVVEAVCDMSGAFIAAVGEVFPNAAVTVDWFHVVQLFTKALDEVRRAEAKSTRLPKALRWAILKRAEGRLTRAQAEALAELEASDLATLGGSRKSCAGSARPPADTPPVGASPISCAMPAQSSAPTPSSSPCRRPSRPLPGTADASWSAGPHPTAPPASKASTACSRRPDPVPGATAIPQPSRP